MHAFSLVSYTKPPKAIQNTPKQPKAAQSSPKQPKAAQSSPSRPTQPKAAQSTPKQPKQPKAAQSSPTQPKAAQSSPSSPEQPKQQLRQTIICKPYRKEKENPGTFLQTLQSGRKSVVRLTNPIQCKNACFFVGELYKA